MYVLCAPAILLVKHLICCILKDWVFQWPRLLLLNGVDVDTPKNINCFTNQFFSLAGIRVAFLFPKEFTNTTSKGEIW